MDEPETPFSPPETPTGRGGGATRMVSIQIATIAIVIATAIALLVYFSAR